MSQSPPHPPWRWWSALLLVLALVLPDGTVRADQVSFILDHPDLIHFYPNAADPTLPHYYKRKPGFPQTLQASILHFTQATLNRDGFPVGSRTGLAVTMNPEGNRATVTITTDPRTAQQVQGYATVLPALLSDRAAGLGWTGVLKCQATPGCWDPGKDLPWAFYLPLGLPVLNQKAVMLLNYPPSDALCAADYLNNFTMARWTGVLQRVGITDPVLYETIVDVHPIAAPGSGQSQYIARTTADFYQAGQPNYDQGMLERLLNPIGERSTTPPLQVAGSDALKVWAGIIGQSTVTPGDVGLFQPPGQPAIPWVATNHPDVTSYQHCPGDPVSTTANHSAGIRLKYTDDQLIQDELLDLQAACTLKTLNDQPTLTPAEALSRCQEVWCTEKNGRCQRRDVCIQARMDYDFNSEGHCQCPVAAELFCLRHGNEACPSNERMTPCSEFNALCPQKSHYSTCESC